MKNRHIAVLRCGGIGDLIQTIPALKNLRIENPEAVITFISGKSAAEALVNCPYIDKLHTFSDSTIYTGTSFQKAKETYRISQMLKGVKTCYVLHKDKRWAIPAMLAGVPDIKSISLISSEKPRAERYSKLLCGNAGNTEYHFFPSEEPYVIDAPYIAIAPGGARNAKNDDKCRRWSGYEELIRDLLDKTNQKIILLGLENDKIGINDKRINDMCGKTSLSDAYHIINNANIFIGNDSGLLHLACCTSTFKIGIFTSTDPAKVLGEQKNTATLRSSLSCSPCEKDGKYSTDCQIQCRESITSDEVFSLVYERLEC
ncbi:MAG: hypothetical protein C0602_01065 [Denitrovibrio sp.]|nr:MAG: hypothetical protein C0602_01065 [Denitrovibrio sp.]